MVAVLVLGALFLLLHTYVLYPLCLIALDALQQARGNLRYLLLGQERRAPPSPTLPDVTLVIAAYNEETCIGQKIANSLALDYPRERLEIVVGSDGSTDGTDAIVRGCPDSRVRLSTAERAGKTSVLNRCIPQARGDIVVLTDANTLLAPDAIRRLVRPFSDPDVGAVCGQLRLFNPRVREYEESAYWKYESLLKLYEGKRGAVMGANGGLYAIRRRLFDRLAPETIVDDFVIPMRILSRGFRVMYEPEAVAREETTEDYAREFGRRARIAAGNFQSLRMLRGLLAPSAGFASFAFWSHKVLRWCAPALMAVVFFGSALLLASPLFRALFATQLVFYLLALVGRMAVLRGAPRRVASFAYYFVTMNWAMVVGFWRFLRNAQRATWDRTTRAAG